MKVIIAGSRHIEDFDALSQLVEGAGWEIDEVVSGGCRGVDEMGERWAEGHGIPVKTFVADWAHYGREAGELRNREMAHYADALILLWDGKSPGASCMLRESARAGIPIHHQVYGMDLADMERAEKEILAWIWSGRGRLVHRHSHWEWEYADGEAPQITQEAVHSLVERGLLEETQLTILRPVRDKIHSKLA